MFVVCGEALWDLFAVETNGQLSFDACCGGSPFNVAVGLARMGQPVSLFTGMSTDPLGQKLVFALKREGVRTDMLKRTDRSTTLSVVALGPDGQPDYAFYGRGAADRDITEENLPVLSPDVWGLHAGSYSLVVQPVGSALLKLFAREKGRLLLTLDPNVRLNVEPDTEIWRKQIDSFIRHADIVKVSDEDLRLLWPGVAVAKIAERWLGIGAGLVVVTQGPGGAAVYRTDGNSNVPGRPVEVRDTVGAGDTFQAALIAGLAELGVRSRADVDAIERSRILQVISFAIAAAGITCTRRGADLPYRKDLPPLRECAD